MTGYLVGNLNGFLRPELFRDHDEAKEAMRKRCSDHPYTKWWMIRVEIEEESTPLPMKDI
jgi:hypothetical protein